MRPVYAAPVDPDPGLLGYNSARFRPRDASLSDPATLQLLLWLVPLLAITGLAGGTLAGLLGVGGGIVVVPVLYWVFGYLNIDPAVRMHLAVGTSLATIVPTSIRSARAHARRQAFDPVIFRRWAPAMAVGALLGTWLATLADFAALTAVFGVVGLVMAIQMGLGNPDWRLAGSLPRGIAGSGILPALIGGLSAMMGIGGGTLSVPAMTLCGSPVHKAVGTAAAFGLVISLPAAAGFMVGGWNAAGLPPMSLGYVNGLGLLIIAPTTLLSVPLGVHLAHTLSQNNLRRAFGVFLGITACRMLWDAVSASVAA